MYTTLKVSWFRNVFLYLQFFQKTNGKITLPKFWFIWLWNLFFCITRVSLWGTIKKTNKSEHWNRSALEPFVIQKSALLFRGWQPNFQKWLQNFKVAASKFNINCSLTSMASKMAFPYISKIASNQCICSKDWWEVWIVGKDCTKNQMS